MLQATRLNCYNNVLYKVYINPFNPTENGIQCAELKPENLKILIILTMIKPLQRTYTRNTGHRYLSSGKKELSPRMS